MPLALKSTEERQFRSWCSDGKVFCGSIALELGDIYHSSAWVGFIASLGQGGCYFRIVPCPLFIGQLMHVIQLLLQSRAFKQEVVKSVSWTVGAKSQEESKGLLLLQLSLTGAQGRARSQTRNISQCLSLFG